MIYRRKCIAEVITQSLQLRVQETLTNLRWYNSGDCAKCLRLDQCFCTIRTVDVSVLVCLRGSCCRGTEFGALKVLWDWADGCQTKWRWLCGCNSAITSFTLLYLVCYGFWLQAVTALQDTSINIKRKNGTRKIILPEHLTSVSDLVSILIGANCLGFGTCATTFLRNSSGWLW